MAAFRDVMALAVAVKDEAKRDMIVRHSAQELGISENAAWDYVRRNWTPRPAGRTKAREAEPRPLLSAEQMLPAELLGLLLANAELVPEAAEKVDVEELKDCAERQVLGRLLRKGAGKGAPDVARFVSSLGEPQMASAAARAMAEEKARSERFAMADARLRFEQYLHYMERKQEAAATTTAPPPDARDDKALREMERRLKELDRRSAEPR